MSGQWERWRRQGSYEWTRDSQQEGAREAQAAFKQTEKMPAVNWNVSTIWDVRDQQVQLRDGTVAAVKLYGNGWSIGTAAGMDIWAACAYLNNNEAIIA